MVQKRYGRDKWEAILEGAGFPKFQLFTTTGDLPDQRITDLMASSCRVLGHHLQRVFDEFAEYWMCDFGPKVYIAFYDGKKNAKEFLLTMDNVHIVVTNAMANAAPPRFTCEWKNPKTLIMNYDSKRGLIDLMVSFIKGVGKYYKEDLKITKLGADKVEVVFAY
jgi:hypothetical protein